MKITFWLKQPISRICGEVIMKNYIVRVYRARPADLSVSGVIEDIESGQRQFFNSLIDLQSMLAHSIGKGQLELPDLGSQELDTHENVAVIG
jgi:hypothetical protein